MHIQVAKLKKILEARGEKISEAQIRLIFKDLPEEFEDIWWITFLQQKEIFVRAVKKYIRVSEDLIRSVL